MYVNFQYNHASAYSMRILSLSTTHSSSSHSNFASLAYFPPYWMELSIVGAFTFFITKLLDADITKVTGQKFKDFGAQYLHTLHYSNIHVWKLLPFLPCLEDYTRYYCHDIHYLYVFSYFKKSGEGWKTFFILVLKLTKSWNIFWKRISCITMFIALVLQKLYVLNHLEWVSCITQHLASELVKSSPFQTQAINYL